MTESAFNRPVPVQEQQAGLKAEPRSAAREAYEIGKEVEAEQAAREEEAASRLDDEPATAPQSVIDELIGENNDLDGLDTVSRGAILDGLRENPITETLNAPNPLAEMARSALEADDDATTHVTAYRGISRAQFIDPLHPIPGIPAGRELTEAEATKALEAVMQERIKEALDNDIETRARVAAIPVSAFAGGGAVRYEGTFQGNPIVSNPTMRPGDVVAVRLTAEQLETTKHLKPGEAWAKAGQSLEPEPPAKVEDLDEF